MSKIMRILANPIVRYSTTALCLYLLFRSVRAQKVLDHLLDVSPLWLTVAVAATAAAVACSVIIWALLLRATGHSLSVGKFVSFYLQGIFFTHVIPGGVGGDAIRTVMTAQITGEGPALASLAASRLAEGVGIIAAALLASLLLRGQLGLASDLTALILAAVLVCVWLLVFQTAAIVKRLPESGPWWIERCRRLLDRFAESFESYRRRKALLAATMAIGIFSWGCNLYALTAFAHAVGADVSWTAFAVCIPAAAATTIAPFAVNGIGLREGVLVAILVHLGTFPSQALAIALLVDFQFLPFVLAGAVFWMSHRPPKQE